MPGDIFERLSKGKQDLTVSLASLVTEDLNNYIGDRIPAGCTVEAAYTQAVETTNPNQKLKVLLCADTFRLETEPFTFITILEIHTWTLDFTPVEPLIKDLLARHGEAERLSKLVWT